MRLKASLLFALAFVSLPLAATPYAPADTDRIVVPAAAGRAAQIDIDGLDAAIRELAPHTSRGLKFDSVGDRQAARKTAQRLSDALQAANAKESPDAELQKLVGHWNTLAWALGYAPAGERAFVHLHAALASEPNDNGVQYLLGSFLTNFDGGDELALPYLERAHEAGMPEATYSLAMVYIQRRDIARAKTLLENFAVRTGSTEDPEFRLMLSFLSTRQIHVNSTTLPPLPAAAKKVR